MTIRSQRKNLDGIMEQQIKTLKPGDHICPIHESLPEQMSIAVAFTQEGLLRKKRCVYVGNDNAVERVRYAFTAAGIDIAHEEARGALRLLTNQEAFHHLDTFSPQKMIAFLHDLESSALTDGFAGLRFIGEMTWILGLDPKEHQLIEYEALLNEYVEGSKTTILCQYQHSHFDSTLIHTILRTHPKVILGELLCVNPYYEPPQLILKQGKIDEMDFKDRLVDWWLLRLKEINKKLQTTETLVGIAGRTARLGGWFIELPEFKIVFSDEVCAIHEVPSGTVLSIQEVINFYAPKWRAIISRHIKACISEGAPYDLEVELITAKDRRIWVRTIGQAERNSNGVITRIQGAFQDINERKHAEVLLRESEERFRTMFSNTATGIATSTPQGNFIQANPAYCEMLGYTEDELRSHTFASLTHPDDLPLNLKLRDEMLAGVRDSFVMEKRYIKKNGDIVWTLHCVTAVRAANGQITLFIVVAENITERKHAEEQLIWKTAFLDAIVNCSLDGMLVVDSKHMKILQNQKMIDLWNIPKDIAEEAAHHQRFAWIKSQVKTPTPELFAEKVAYLYAHPDESIHDELELINGEYLERYSASVKGKDGKYYGRIWVYRNITERKHIEARFRRLVDSNAQAVFFWNIKGEITAGNDAFLKLTCYSREDLEAGRINWAAMTPPEYAALDQAALKEISETRVCAPYEKEWICKDGTRVPILLGATVFEDNPDEGVCFVLDLTERKKLEQQFRQAQKMEAIGQLAGGIAHDFNNLLTVINGYSDVLMSSLSADDPSQRFLSFIKEAGEQSSALTSQLLAFSKNQFLSPKAMDLNEVVHKVEKMLQRIIGEDITLSTALTPDLGNIMADPTQVEQILLNLAVNARDAMPEGGKLTIETKHIELDEAYARTHPDSKPGSYVMLAVTDSGVGIPEEVKQHIFEPFFTTKGVGKGTGLGLSVIHGIVKQSEGSIEVYSEPGQGTCFKIYLPQITCAVIAEAPALDTKTIPRGSETILLVEDEANVREFARHVLEGYGYTILIAANAKEALRISEQHKSPIHLLLTDVVMPEIGGRALAEQLQPTRPAMKVLFMSGYTEDAVVRHGILHEQVNFLQKPYSPLALAKKVSEVIKS